MVDPRINIIHERLRNIRNIVAVSSGKGGVGKSLVASILSLILVRKGYRVGLFDLDFTGPSTHIILGIGEFHLKEEKGIVPPEAYGLRYMSIVYYAREHASPLRGAEVSNALIELLAVTLWDRLDFLILDMPPGMGDATLDIIRFVKNVKFLVVTTPSRLAFETVGKLLDLLSELKVSVIGVIENMKMDDSQFIRHQVEKKGIRFCGDIPYDLTLEENVSHVDRLLETKFSKGLEVIADKNLKSLLII